MKASACLHVSSSQELPYIVSITNSYFYSSTELTFQYIQRGCLLLTEIILLFYLVLPVLALLPLMVLLHTTIERATASVRPAWDYSSQNIRLEGTPRIIWPSLSWKNHSLDKKAQDPLQLGIACIQCWRNQQLPGKIGYSFSWLLLLWKMFLSCPIGISPGITATHHLSSFPCKRESLSSL